MPLVRVVQHDQNLRALLNGPNGGVARDLARRAVNVQSQAKRNATGRPGPNVQTGRLRSSISWDLVTGSSALRGFAQPTGGGDLVARVGTNVIYGLYLETGQTRNGRKFPFLSPALKAAAD